MNTAEQRKATPLWSGVLRYFPDALQAVARLSKAGNDHHNPGQPLHWSRGESDDHGDCILRHQLEPDSIDPETGELHAAAVAWRALAQLQLLEEQRKSVPRDTPLPDEGDSVLRSPFKPLRMEQAIPPVRRCLQDPGYACRSQCDRYICARDGRLTGLAQGGFADNAAGS